MQLVGATPAALFLRAVIHASAVYGSNYPAHGYSDVSAFWMELVLTTGLVSVILGTASGAQNVDALLASLSASGETDSPLMDIPVLLAAAGMTDEASEALASAQSFHPEEAKDLLVGKYLDKFITWLNDGASRTPPYGT
jgi:hypothetical protein